MMSQYLIGIMITLLLLLGAEQYGEHRIQSKWDIAKAEVEAITEREKAENKKNLKDLKDQYAKDIEHEKSEAGRAAIRRWLHEHGLLPNGSPMRSTDSGSQTEVPQRVNGTACECRSATIIEEFAGRCASDARKVELCTEWAVRENLETY